MAEIREKWRAKLFGVCAALSRWAAVHGSELQHVTLSPSKDGADKSVVHAHAPVVQMVCALRSVGLDASVPFEDWNDRRARPTSASPPLSFKEVVHCVSERRWTALETYRRRRESLYRSADADEELRRAYGHWRVLRGDLLTIYRSNCPFKTQRQRHEELCRLSPINMTRSKMWCRRTQHDAFPALSQAYDYFGVADRPPQREPMQPLDVHSAVKALDSAQEGVIEAVCDAADRELSSWFAACVDVAATRAAAKGAAYAVGKIKAAQKNGRTTGRLCAQALEELWNELIDVLSVSSGVLAVLKSLQCKPTKPGSGVINALNALAKTSSPTPTSLRRQRPNDVRVGGRPVACVHWVSFLREVKAGHVLSAPSAGALKAAEAALMRVQSEIHGKLRSQPAAVDTARVDQFVFGCKPAFVAVETLLLPSVAAEAARHHGGDKQLAAAQMSVQRAKFNYDLLRDASAYEADNLDLAADMKRLWKARIKVLFWRALQACRGDAAQLGEAARSALADRLYAQAATWHAMDRDVLFGEGLLHTEQWAADLCRMRDAVMDEFDGLLEVCAEVRSRERAWPPNWQWVCSRQVRGSAPFPRSSSCLSLAVREFTGKLAESAQSVHAPAHLPPSWKCDAVEVVQQAFAEDFEEARARIAEVVRLQQSQAPLTLSQVCLALQDASRAALLLCSALDVVERWKSEQRG